MGGHDVCFDSSSQNDDMLGLDAPAYPRPVSDNEKSPTPGHPLQFSINSHLARKGESSVEGASGTDERLELNVD